MLVYVSVLGFNTTLESEINQLGDEIFGVLRDLENLTAGKLVYNFTNSCTHCQGSPFD